MRVGRCAADDGVAGFVVLLHPIDQPFKHFVHGFGGQIEDPRAALDGLLAIGLQHIITRRRRRGVNDIGLDIQPHPLEPLHHAQRAVTGVAEDGESLLFLLQARHKLDRARQGVILVAKRPVQIKKDRVIGGEVDGHWQWKCSDAPDRSNWTAIGLLNRQRRRRQFYRLMLTGPQFRKHKYNQRRPSQQRKQRPGATGPMSESASIGQLPNQSCQ